jgi:small subunit ribosomal protein S21
MPTREPQESFPTIVAPVENTHVPILGRPLEVRVDDRGVERAIRKLRRLLASEGVLREIKRRRHHEKPSIKEKRKVREADRRRKRRARKMRSPMDRETTAPGAVPGANPVSNGRPERM